MRRGEWILAIKAFLGTTVGAGCAGFLDYRVLGLSKRARGLSRGTSVFSNYFFLLLVKRNFQDGELCNRAGTESKLASTRQ